jgi:hypothetical protein
MLAGFEQLNSYFALQCGDKGVEGGGEECKPGELGSGKVLAYLNEILFVGTNSNDYRVCLSTSLPLALVERATLEEVRAVDREETAEAAEMAEDEVGKRERTEGEWDDNLLDVGGDLSLVLCNREDLGKRRPTAQAVLEFAVRSWKDMLHVPFQTRRQHGSLLLANLHLPGAEEELTAVLRAAIETLQRRRATDDVPTVLETFKSTEKNSSAAPLTSESAVSEGERTLQVLFGGTVAVKGAGGEATEKVFYPESLSVDIDVARVVSASPEPCVFSVSLADVAHEEYREESGLGLEVEVELCLKDTEKQRLDGLLRVRHRHSLPPSDSVVPDVKRVQEVAFHLVGGRGRLEEGHECSSATMLQHWATTDRLAVEKLEGGLADEELAKGADHAAYTVQEVQQDILRRQELLQKQPLFLHFGGAAVLPDSGLDQQIGVNVELGMFFTRR